MGIEPTLSAWKAEVLPLNYARVLQNQNQRAADYSLISDFYNLEGEGFEPSKA
jgi:hypothetical protein